MPTVMVAGVVVLLANAVRNPFVDEVEMLNTCCAPSVLVTLMICVWGVVLPGIVEKFSDNGLTTTEPVVELPVLI